MDSFVHLKIALVITSLCTLASSSRYELRRDILRNYDKGILPYRNGTTIANGTTVDNGTIIDNGTIVDNGTTVDNRITVHIEFCPERLTEFDERAGKFAMSGYLEIYWEDPRIARNWALSSHQSPDIETVYFSESEVWTPQILHVNSFSRFDTEKMYDSTVLFSLDGWAYMKKREVFTSKCKVDFLNFPSETQYCSIELGITGYYMGEIKLTSPSISSSGCFEEDVTWDINSMETDVTNIAGWSASIKFKFLLKRAASYFSIIVWMPMALLLLLQFLCFAIPRKSGERVGISMTVILALAIYLTILTNYIPQASRSGVPIMIVWVFGGLLNSCMVHGFIVFGLHVPKEKDHPIYRIAYSCLPKNSEGHVRKGAYDLVLCAISYNIFFIFWTYCTFNLL